MRMSKFRVLRCADEYGPQRWEYITLPEDIKGETWMGQDDYLWETWSQWIGHTDKNGEEIYEGDIVTWHGEDATGWHSYKTVVKWNEEDVYFDVPLQRRWIQDREVIGNIHENPELKPV